MSCWCSLRVWNFHQGRESKEWSFITTLNGNTLNLRGKTLNNSECEWSLVSCVGNKANMLQKDQCGDPFPNPRRQVSKCPMCLALATTGKDSKGSHTKGEWVPSSPLLSSPLHSNSKNSTAINPLIYTKKSDLIFLTNS